MTFRQRDIDTMSDATRIAQGISGTCDTCGKVVCVRVPAGGDGSLRLCRPHGPVKARCEGSDQPAKEWVW